MGKVKVYAPNAEYTGLSAGVSFANGVAEVDEAESYSALAYFRSAGYGVGAKPTPAAAPEGGAAPPAVVSLGTPLRDAAVEPEPQDFLPPINAGEADPHGPLVVSPEIHASGPKGIKPGDVLVHDVDRQQAEEAALAEATLIEQQDKGVAIPASETPVDRSAAAEAARGNAAPAAAPAGAEATTIEAVPEVPTKSANKAAWVDYAVAKGLPREEAEDLSKPALIDKYSGG